VGPAFCARFADHRFDFMHQRRHVVRDAVLDRPLDPAAVRVLNAIGRSDGA
jgi:hypothetical protein